MRSEEGEVRAAVADVVTRLTHVDSGKVQPDASLKELGLDSLLTVELAEELGRRYDIQLSDTTINELRTVEDAVHAVTQHHDNAKRPRRAVAIASRPFSSPSHAPVRPDVVTYDEGATTPLDEPINRKRFTASAITTGVTMIVVGIALGLGIGYGLSTMLHSMGLSKSDLPPIAAPTTETVASEEPTPDPEPTESEPTPEEPEVPEPTLTASSQTVPPGTRFTLSGAIPEVGPGTELRVQVKDQGSDWDDFPVTLTTGEDGAFSAEVYTSRTGAREWRLIDGVSGKTTPSVTVTIG